MSESKKVSPGMTMLAALVTLWIESWVVMVGLNWVHHDYAPVPALGYWASLGAMLVIWAVSIVWRPTPPVEITKNGSKR